MADIVVPLSRSYPSAEKSFAQVTLREPTYKEIYMDGLGKPEEWQMTKGGPMRVVYADVVDSYLQRLVVEPGHEYIGGLNAIDSLKLEGAVCDFFRDIAASKTPSTGLSSEEASPSTSSKE